MLSLPWKKDDDPSILLKKEVTRQLQIMSDSKPDSEEYKAALARYEHLHEHEIKDLKIRESRHARWFDALVTGGIMGFTLTAEQWTPLTSRWITGIMHPRKSKDIDW